MLKISTYKEYIIYIFRAQILHVVQLHSHSFLQP